MTVLVESTYTPTWQSLIVHPLNAMPGLLIEDSWVGREAGRLGVRCPSELGRFNISHALSKASLEDFFPVLLMLYFPEALKTTQKSPRLAGFLLQLIFQNLEFHLPKILFSVLRALVSA